MKLIDHIKAISNAWRYSLSGLKYLLIERAFRHELFLGIFVFFIECFRTTTYKYKFYLTLAYFLILLAEALNTSIEALCDRVSLDFHELSKKAKDTASAAVLLMLIHFAIVWLAGFAL